MTIIFLTDICHPRNIVSFITHPSDMFSQIVFHNLSTNNLQAEKEDFKFIKTFSCFQVRGWKLKEIRGKCNLCLLFLLQGSEHANEKKDYVALKISTCASLKRGERKIPLNVENLIKRLKVSPFKIVSKCSNFILKHI